MKEDLFSYKNGVDIQGKIRQDVKNKQKWVFEVYYPETNGTGYRKYPNVISSRYKSKKNCIKAYWDYVQDDILDFYGDDQP